MLREQEQAMQAAIQEAVDRAVQNMGAAPASATANANANNSNSSFYELVMLRQNQRIRPKTGNLELIVRPGSRARVASQHQDMGLANLTSGQEHIGGDIVPVNNLLLIPRADGRSLVILSETAFVFVRGDYEIE
jgi:hypothetical protein